MSASSGCGEGCESKDDGIKKFEFFAIPKASIPISCAGNPKPWMLVGKNGMPLMCYTWNSKHGSLTQSKGTIVLIHGYGSHCMFEWLKSVTLKELRMKKQNLFGIKEEQELKSLELSVKKREDGFVALQKKLLEYRKEHSELSWILDFNKCKREEITPNRIQLLKLEKLIETAKNEEDKQWIELYARKVRINELLAQRENKANSNNLVENYLIEDIKESKSECCTRLGCITKSQYGNEIDELEKDISTQSNDNIFSDKINSMNDNEDSKNKFENNFTLQYEGSWVDRFVQEGWEVVGVDLKYKVDFESGQSDPVYLNKFDDLSCSIKQLLEGIARRSSKPVFMVGRSLGGCVAVRAAEMLCKDGNLGHPGDKMNASENLQLYPLEGQIAPSAEKHISRVVYKQKPVPLAGLILLAPLLDVANNTNNILSSLLISLLKRLQDVIPNLPLINPVKNEMFPEIQSIMEQESGDMNGRMKLKLAMQVLEGVSSAHEDAFWLKRKINKSSEKYHNFNDWNILYHKTHPVPDVSDDTTKTDEITNSSAEKKNKTTVEGNVVNTEESTKDGEKDIEEEEGKVDQSSAEDNVEKPEKKTNVDGENVETNAAQFDENSDNLPNLSVLIIHSLKDEVVPCLGSAVFYERIGGLVNDAPEEFLRNLKKERQNEFNKYVKEWDSIEGDLGETTASTPEESKNIDLVELIEELEIEELSQQDRAYKDEAENADEAYLERNSKISEFGEAESEYIFDDEHANEVQGVLNELTENEAEKIENNINKEVSDSKKRKHKRGKNVRGGIFNCCENPRAPSINNNLYRAKKGWRNIAGLIYDLHSCKVNVREVDTLIKIVNKYGTADVPKTELEEIRDAILQARMIEIKSKVERKQSGAEMQWEEGNFSKSGSLFTMLSMNTNSEKDHESDKPTVKIEEKQRTIPFDGILGDEAYFNTTADGHLQLWLLNEHNNMLTKEPGNEKLQSSIISYFLKPRMSQLKL